MLGFLDLYFTFTFIVYIIVGVVSFIPLFIWYSREYYKDVERSLFVDYKWHIKFYLTGDNNKREALRTTYYDDVNEDVIYINHSLEDYFFHITPEHKISKLEKNYFYKKFYKLHPGMPRTYEEIDSYGRDTLKYNSVLSDLNQMSQYTTMY